LRASNARSCSHLRTVIRADVFGYASFEHRIGHRLDDPKAVNATSHSDRQAFPGELVNQGHEPELSTIVGLRLNEVVAPEMIAVLRSQPNAGAVVEAQPPSRLLPFGYFKPLTAPDPLDAITANLPAGFGKKRPDPSIAIASIMRSQRDNRSRQRIFISPDDGGASLRPGWLADNPTGMTFRETVLPHWRTTQQARPWHLSARSAHTWPLERWPLRVSRTAMVRREPVG
jgi:hypothetical protein